MGRKRIGIIGHFGGGNEFLDGQTVKTKVLYEELSSAGYENIFKVDTYYNQTNKIKLLWDTFRCVLSCRAVIMLLSSNGMRVYFPLMYLAKKIFRVHVWHDVIGGNLAQKVKENPKYKKYLNAMDGNWVEFEKMKDELEALGVTNCTVVPNFKRLDTQAAKESISGDALRRFCMFSRVMKEKGMSDAILAASEYNSTHNDKIFINIWGPVSEDYKEEFESLLDEHGDAAAYMGKVNYSDSVRVLTDHAALLFPTYWDGEGFPGTILDAYSAGIPVIASDWNANRELVDNFSTGWVYPNEKINTLGESLRWAAEHPEEMVAMRKECIKKAEEYSPRVQIEKIIKMIG